MVHKNIECSKCLRLKPPDMFWLSPKKNRPTKWCKACLWADRWQKINGRAVFSKSAETHLNEIYNFLGKEERLEAFIHETEQAVRQKSEKNYTYAAIRLGRSIEFLTFVLCDAHGIQADALSGNLVSARTELQYIESKYAALVDKVGINDFETSERKEIRNSFKTIIDKLVEFEIEVAGGEIGVCKGEAHPSVSALLRRIGKRINRRHASHECVGNVSRFMADFRNRAAHTDAHGAGKQEIRRQDVRDMMARYEQVLKNFAALVT